MKKLRCKGRPWLWSSAHQRAPTLTQGWTGQRWATDRMGRGRQRNTHRRSSCGQWHFLIWSWQWSHHHRFWLPAALWGRQRQRWRLITMGHQRTAAEGKTRSPCVTMEGAATITPYRSPCVKKKTIIGGSEWGVVLNRASSSQRSATPGSQWDIALGGRWDSRTSSSFASKKQKKVARVNKGTKGCGYNGPSLNLI